MKAGADNSQIPHEEEHKQVDTLEPDEMLNYQLDSIRTLTDTPDKFSTLDLMKFDLSELTATLFSTDSDTLGSSSEFNTLSSDSSEYKRSNLESILSCDQGVSAIEDELVKIKLDGPDTNTMRSLSTPHDVMNDLDHFLDLAHCDSQYSTLDMPPNILSRGGSQYSTLDSADSGLSPQHRIVSQPIPSVDSLSHFPIQISQSTDEISDFVTDKILDHLAKHSERAAQKPGGESDLTTDSMTFVSSFSLNTWDKTEGDDVVNIIKSETPASYEDCSLKLVQPTDVVCEDDSSTLTPETTPLSAETVDIMADLDELAAELVADEDTLVPEETLVPDEDTLVPEETLVPDEDTLVPEESVGGSVVREDSVGELAPGQNSAEDTAGGKVSVEDLATRQDSVGDTAVGENIVGDTTTQQSSVGDATTAQSSVEDHDAGKDGSIEYARRERTNSDTFVKDPAVKVSSLISDGVCEGDEVRDSGFDSLESSTASAPQPTTITEGSRGGKSPGTSNQSTMSSTGGTQCSGSGNSLEDVSCPSSPVMSDSSEQIQNIISTSTSLSSLPDVPTHGVRSRSAASNVSDHVLTTLDRPRTQSFAGTPIRQAWLQVCCYERDTQTGNFLIDKHKVQVDGLYLHPELNTDPELYRISLPGLVNEDRLPKTDKVLHEIGDGVIISRDRATGNVTLTKLCRKDVYMMNESFLALKEDEKCKGKHEKLEQNTTYTIFNKQQFVEDVRNSAIDLTKIHTIGQIAIAFIKINGNSVKGVPCWVKVQCLEAMNLLKSLLAGSTPKDREWLRREPSMESPQSPRRTSIARLSFGKSLSKTSLKDSKSSVNSSDSGNTPIPRSKSKSQLFKSRKKGLPQSNGASPEPRSNRNSGASQHLEPFTLNYGCLDVGEEPPSQQLRDNELLRSRRISSPPNNLTSADVSLPLRRASPSPDVPTT